MSEKLTASDVLGSSFKNTSSSGGGANKLPCMEADYVIEIDTADIFKSTNPNTAGHPIFTLNFIVRQSSTEKVDLGVKKSWTQNLTQSFGEKEYGKENLKQFVASAFGLVPGSDEANALGNEHVQAVLDGQTKGVLVRCTTVPKVSKAQREWTLHIFSPYESGSE